MGVVCALLAQLASGQGSARIDVLAVATAAGDVVAVVEVPGDELLAGSSPGSLDGALTLRLIDEGGAEASSIEQPFALTLTGRVEGFRETGLRYFATFPKAAPGAYVLEVSLAAGEASAAGTGRVVVAAAGERHVWPPLVAARDPRWLSYAQSVGPGATVAVDYPFVRPDGSQFVPSASGRVAPGQTTRLELFARGVASLEDVSWQVVGPDGGVEGAVVESGSSMPTSSSSLHQTASLLLPDVPLGTELRLELAIDESLTSGVGLTVAAPPDLLASVEMPEPAADLEAVEVDDDARRAAEQVLQRLADGDEQTALASLLKASLGRDEAPTSGESRKWRAAFVGAARRVAKQDAEAVLPIVLLQKLATEEHARHGRLSQGAQSVMTQLELAHLYIDRLPSAERASRGADLLAVLGDYHGALELDPEHQLSLLRLALGDEQHGHWQTATDLLQRLAPLRPHDHEVLLRLGLGLARTDRVEEGRRTLMSILGEKRVDSRVAVLTFQELGRLEIAAGRLGHALEILERGQSLFPDNQRLRLQLALCYEKLGRRVDAERQLNRIEPTPPPASETARSWYTHGAEEEKRRARALFAEQARALLPRLAELRGSGVTR